MGLIDKKEFSKVTKLEKLKLDGILTNPLMKLLKIQDLNEKYDEVSHYQGIDFISETLKLCKIKYEVSEKELQNLPKDGAFLTVSNHPYGGIDGLILLELIAKQRPDFKVMANFLLHKISNISDFILPVNPFDKLTSDQSSMAGIKMTLAALRDGKPVGIFPSGEVSSFNKETFKIRDNEWKPMVGRIIDKAKVPVVPIYFSGSNSYIFNLLGLINPNFRTIKLPSEILNKESSTIKVRIGKPIKYKTLEEFNDPAQMLRFLRVKTYALGSALEVKKFYLTPRFLTKKKEEIVAETPLQLIESDIDKLYNTEKHIIKQDDVDVFIAYSTEIPNVLNEIGRLREITFREVGEGTNKSIDLDEFDLYYHHLFIWDRVNKKVVGSYRIGKGNDIYRKFRKKGFYINSLFKIKNGFVPILKESIEMGRSFVRKEYQQKPFSLFLLWKAILIFLRQNPKFRYLIGPVSISNNFSNISKSLIIDYVKRNHFDNNLGQYIEPRTEFKYQVKDKDIDKDILLNNHSDIKSLDDVISEIEPSHMRTPILLKKYFQLDAKIIGFNIDPKFENALDGFVVLDFHSVPEQVIEMLDKAGNK